MLQCSIWLEPSYHSPSSPFNWTILLTTLLFLTIAWKYLVFLSTERPNYSWLSNPTYSLPFASTPLVAQNPFSSLLWVCLFLKKKKKKNSPSCSLICCSPHTSSSLRTFAWIACKSSLFWAMALSTCPKTALSSYSTLLIFF